MGSEIVVLDGYALNPGDLSWEGLEQCGDITVYERTPSHLIVERSLMKPSAFLINTARGKLIREADLADALNHDRIAGAAVDVLSQEPPNQGNPLFTAKHCIITPHIAWASRESRTRLLHTAIENVSSFLKGTPGNIVAGRR